MDQSDGQGVRIMNLFAAAVCYKKRLTAKCFIIVILVQCKPERVIRLLIRD